MRDVTRNKRPWERGGDEGDMTCGLDVYEEFDEMQSVAWQEDPHEGEEFTDEKMSGAPPANDSVPSARAEDMSWYDKFEAYEDVTD